MTWTKTRLKFLASVPIQNGLGEPGGQDNPDWPRYVRTTDIAGPRTLRDDVFASLPPEVAARAPLHRGDIVMTAAGATIGKSLLYESDIAACYAGYLARFRPRQDVDSRFIAYWMESRPYWDQIAIGKVVSTIENFSAGKYQNMILEAPDVASQRVIANCLDVETTRIDALIEKKQRIVLVLEQRRMSEMTYGISGHLTSRQVVPSTLPWLEQVGRSWREVKLNYVARLGSGHTPSRDHPEWWTNCDIPWITTGEVAQMRTDGSITSTRRENVSVRLASRTRQLRSIPLGLSSSAAQQLRRVTPPSWDQTWQRVRTSLLGPVARCSGLASCFSALGPCVKTYSGGWRWALHTKLSICPTSSPCGCRYLK